MGIYWVCHPPPFFAMIQLCNLSMDMIQAEQRTASEKLPELQVIEDNWFKPTVHYTTTIIRKTSKKWVVDMSVWHLFCKKHALSTWSSMKIFWNKSICSYGRMNELQKQVAAPTITTQYDILWHFQPSQNMPSHRTQGSTRALLNSPMFPPHLSLIPK